MVTLVTIRPGVTFASGAAASFKRAEKAWRKRITSNFTYRSPELQQKMYEAWTAYVNGTGPKPPHGRAIQPKYSWHCKGLAIDTDDWKLKGFIALMKDHGWIRVVSKEEPWHFQYYADQDKHLGEPAGEVTPAPKPPTPVTPVEEEEDDMKGAFYKNANGVTVYVLFNEVSGFYHEWVGINPASNNTIATTWKTGPWMELTASVAGALKSNLANVRSGKGL